MATNENDHHDFGESVEREVILDNGLVTEVQDVCDELSDDPGRTRYHFLFSQQVEFASGRAGYACFSSRRFFTASEVHILRELLKDFELNSVRLDD